MRPICLRPVVFLLALVATGAWPGAAGAQELALSLGDGGSLTARSIQLLVLITLLSLVPGLAVMVTCFPFIVTVLSILRQAIGLQQSPPQHADHQLGAFFNLFRDGPNLYPSLGVWGRTTDCRITGP